MKKGTRCTRWDQLGDTLPGLAHTSRYTLILNRTELGSDTENETSFGFGSSRHCQDKGGLFLFFGVFLEGGCQKWIRLLGGGCCHSNQVHCDHKGSRMMLSSDCLDRDWVNGKHNGVLKNHLFIHLSIEDVRTYSV